MLTSCSVDIESGLSNREGDGCQSMARGVGLTIRWLIGLIVAGLTLWYTVVRALDRVHPLDAVNLGLILIAVICVLVLAYPEIFSRVHSIEAAGVKIELLETKQNQQQRQLDEFGLILPVLLPPPERMHLLNLALGNTKEYTGNDSVRTELRRLRSIGLVNNSQPIANIRDGATFDLSNFVHLTDLGQKWIPRLLQYERDVEAQSNGARV